MLVLGRLLASDRLVPRLCGKEWLVAASSRCPRCFRYSAPGGVAWLSVRKNEGQRSATWASTDSLGLRLRGAMGPPSWLRIEVKKPVLYGNAFYVRKDSGNHTIRQIRLSAWRRGAVLYMELS